MSPCLGCIEKTCVGCPCAICEVKGNDLQDSNTMKAAEGNRRDCCHFMVRLSNELESIRRTEDPKWTDKHNWRGFPAGWFDHDHLLLWLIAHCLKENT